MALSADTSCQRGSGCPPHDIARPGLGGRISCVFDWLTLITVLMVPDGKSCMKGFGVSYEGQKQGVRSRH